MLLPITDAQLAALHATVRSMPRERHQNGFLQETGKKTKKWTGHYYVYVQQEGGQEKRVHKSVVIGPKAELKKWEAQERLRAIIAEATVRDVRPSPAVTLEWFWRNRYRPLKEPMWKRSNAPKMIWSIENYVIRPFGEKQLGALNRFDLQTHLNKLAQDFSRSVVLTFRTYAKAILDEAIEQDFLVKNPARKLEVPKTRKPSKRALSVEEVASLLAGMSGRDRLITRMFLVLGLRPGELFALRHNDRLPSSIRVDETLSPLTGIEEPKTDASNACVWLPAGLATELDAWLAGQKVESPNSFMFPSRAGTPTAAGNWLKRKLKIAAKSVVDRHAESGESIPEGFLAGVTLQSLRRSCATHMQHAGSLKDIQGHLRHARPDVTAAIYMQEIPASVREAVESLDQKLRTPMNSPVVNRTELNINLEGAA